MSFEVLGILENIGRRVRWWSLEKKTKENQCDIFLFVTWVETSTRIFDWKVSNNKRDKSSFCSGISPRVSVNKSLDASVI